jgi:hypothetical protein
MFVPGDFLKCKILMKLKGAAAERSGHFKCFSLYLHFSLADPVTFLPEGVVPGF